MLKDKKAIQALMTQAGLMSMGPYEMDLEHLEEAVHAFLQMLCQKTGATNKNLPAKDHLPWDNLERVIMAMCVESIRLVMDPRFEAIKASGNSGK